MYPCMKCYKCYKCYDFLFMDRGDFEVMFGDGTSNVIKLLETACLGLAVMSSKRLLLNQPADKSPKHYLYKMMVWGMLLAV